MPAASEPMPPSVRNEPVASLPGSCDSDPGTKLGEEGAGERTPSGKDVDDSMMDRFFDRYLIDHGDLPSCIAELETLPQSLRMHQANQPTSHPTWPPSHSATRPTGHPVTQTPGHILHLYMIECFRSGLRDLWVRGPSGWALGPWAPLSILWSSRY